MITELKDAVFLDSSLTYDGVANGLGATAVVDGLWHLEGCIVQALCDGEVVMTDVNGDLLVVVDGKVTLAASYTVIHVGLPYVSEIETLRLELQDSATSLGRTKAIRKVSVLTNNSKGFEIGPTADKLSTPVEFGELAAGELLSGEIEHRIKGDWNKNGTVIVRQTFPLPMTVQGIISFIEPSE